MEVRAARMTKDLPFKSLLAAGLLGLVLWGGLPLYRHRHYGVPIIKGPGVTDVRKLSEYSPGSPAVL